MAKTKIIAKKSVKAIMKERTILTTLCADPNDSVINIKAAFQDTNRLYLLMYYIKGKDLRYYLNNRLSLA
jgi:serine/threonine protein kinase